MDTPVPKPSAEARLRSVLAKSRELGRVRPSQPPRRPALRPAVLERLLSLSRRMNRITRRDDLLAYLRDRLHELFEAQNSLVVLISRDGTLHLLGDEDGADVDHAISHTLIARVVTERRPVLVSDTARDRELHDRTSVQRLGLVSVLCAPLIVDDEVIGVLQFDHRSRPGPFTEEDLTVLELFAHQSATAIRNSLLVERLEAALDQTRTAQERLVATERLRALGEMAAAVAHDFNNMLASVIGLSDLILGAGRVAGADAKDLRALQNIALSGASTVGRLQEFAGGASGDDRATNLDLSVLVREVVDAVRHRLEPRADGPFWSVSLELTSTSPVRGRASEVRDVVLNLLLNAIDAMAQGGVVIIRTMERSGQVVLEVEDDGPGIPSETKHRVFEPFFTTKRDGHGLGLSTCWGVVHRMDGDIELQEPDAQGTRFVVSLPPAVLDIPSQGPEDADAAPVSARILMVDDEPMVRTVMGRMLERAGHSTVVACDGTEALSLLDDSFDLVITDYDMPDMNGAELASRIAATRPDCPVILLSGWNPGGGDCPIDGEGIDLVLRKPITTDRLAAAVRETLRDRS